MKKIISIIIGCVIAIVLCEFILRIYNPFQSRIRGHEIILKSHFKKQISITPQVNGLNSNIIYSTNELGFRGETKPKDWEQKTTIITVGGSTTECSLLDDDSTWSQQLFKMMQKTNSKVWVNNAGIDGCSSFGHIILMRDYIVKLKPKYVVFLVGINDVAKSNFNQEDGFLINRKESWLRSLLKQSELITTISNVYNALKSHQANVAHGITPYDYKQNDFNLMDSSQRLKNEETMPALLMAYQSRIETLIQMCKLNGIKAIFVTQPKFDDVNAYSWKVMQSYNATLKSTCISKQVPCIDLASQLEKDPTYYYDQIHFTNKGARKVASVLNPQLLQIIK